MRIELLSLVLLQLSLVLQVYTLSRSKTSRKLKFSTSALLVFPAILFVDAIGASFKEKLLMVVFISVVNVVSVHIILKIKSKNSRSNK